MTVIGAAKAQWKIARGYVFVFTGALQACLENIQFTQADPSMLHSPYGRSLRRGVEAVICQVRILDYGVEYCVQLPALPIRPSHEMNVCRNRKESTSWPEATQIPYFSFQANFKLQLRQRPPPGPRRNWSLRRPQLHWDGCWDQPCGRCSDHDVG